MKNFKINTNHQPLTPDDIARGQDFGQLMSAYKAAKPPFYKGTAFKIFAAGLVACIIGTAVFFALKDEAITTLSAFINPPIEGIDITYTTYQIDATKDSVVFYKTGSAIRIPANAFLDESGNKVTGQVELQYREFHTVQEAFIAGIPMNYDSAGQKMFFETAGMMEISASQNGKQLKPNPEAMINVNMISYNDAERFNSYYLDTVKRKWEYKGKSIAELVALRAEETNQVDPKNAGETAINTNQIFTAPEEATKMPAPVLPAKADISKPRFRIEVSEEEFPEIAVYKNVKFQPTADANYDPKKAKIEWTSGEIKRLPNSTAYEVVFSNATESYSVKATPVFEEKDINEAQQLYNEYTIANNKKVAKQEKAKKKKAEKDAQEAKNIQADKDAETKLMQEEANNAADLRIKQMEEASAKAYDNLAQRFKARQAALEASADAAIAEQERQYAAQMAIIERENKEYERLRTERETSQRNYELIYRTFQVSKFGYWNGDCAAQMPSGAKANATIVLPGSESFSSVYLAEKGVNKMIVYYALDEFRYNPNAKNVLWGMTQSGKLFIMKPEEFAIASKTGKNITLHMQLIDKKFTNVAEVKSYLEI